MRNFSSDILVHVVSIFCALLSSHLSMISRIIPCLLSISQSTAFQMQEGKH